eukprot:RCo036882
METALFFDVLTALNEMQSTHGLRSGDFLRYRQYCSRRIRRLCQALKFLHGSGKVFVKKEITASACSDIRYWHLLILYVERAWAFAENLKDDSESDLRKRRHRLSKLRKATKWSQLLVQLSTTSLDACSQRQIEAYHAEMTGMLLSSRQKWSEALSSFTRARDVWQACLEQPSFSSLLTKDLVLQRAAAIEQNRRLCWYKSGLDMAGFHAKFGADASGTALDGDPSAAAVSFLDRPVRFHSEKLRDLYSASEAKLKTIAAERAKQDSSSHGTTAQNTIVEMYDKLFIDYNDALAAVKHDLRTERADSSSLHLLNAFFTFLLHEHTLQRNLFLLETYAARFIAAGERLERAGKEFRGAGVKAVEPAAVVRLCDILLQNLNEMMSTPGVEGGPMAAKYEDLRHRIQASRMYWKGEAFCKVGRLAEATASFLLAEQLVSTWVIFDRKSGLPVDEATA